VDQSLPEPASVGQSLPEPASLRLFMQCPNLYMLQFPASARVVHVLFQSNNLMPSEPFDTGRGLRLFMQCLNFYPRHPNLYTRRVPFYTRRVPFYPRHPNLYTRRVPASARRVPVLFQLSNRLFMQCLNFWSKHPTTRPRAQNVLFQLSNLMLMSPLISFDTGRDQRLPRRLSPSKRSVDFVRTRQFPASARRVPVLFQLSNRMPMSPLDTGVGTVIDMPPIDGLYECILERHLNPHATLSDRHLDTTERTDEVRNRGTHIFPQTIGTKARVSTTEAR
jgi:hypothetical protein